MRMIELASSIRDGITKNHKRKSSSGNNYLRRSLQQIFIEVKYLPYPGVRLKKLDVHRFIHVSD